MVLPACLPASLSLSLSLSQAITPQAEVQKLQLFVRPGASEKASQPASLPACLPACRPWLGAHTRFSLNSCAPGHSSKPAQASISNLYSVVPPPWLLLFSISLWVQVPDGKAQTLGKASLWGGSLFLSFSLSPEKKVLGRRGGGRAGGLGEEGKVLASTLRRRCSY